MPAVQEEESRTQPCVASLIAKLHSFSSICIGASLLASCNASDQVAQDCTDYAFDIVYASVQQARSDYHCIKGKETTVYGFIFKEEGEYFLYDSLDAWYFRDASKRLRLNTEDEISASLDNITPGSPIGVRGPLRHPTYGLSPVVVEEIKFPGNQIVDDLD